MAATGAHYSPDVARILVELKASMLMQGMTFVVLAELSGVARRTLHDWFHGTCQPHLDSLQRVAKVLGYEVTIDIKIKGE